MRALLAQWRIEVRWWRGGLATPASMEGLSGGVCGATPPFMSLESIGEPSPPYASDGTVAEGEDSRASEGVVVDAEACWPLPGGWGAGQGCSARLWLGFNQAAYL